jgi:protein-S-isoprenylcysteine O-methyltransferase Ste14
VAKLVRFNKFTIKVLATLVCGILLVAVADPKPGETYFFVALSLILLGEGVRIWAAGHLRKNAELTTTGPYSHVKNPLYIGTFLITTGMCVLAWGGRTGHPVFDNLNWIVLGGFILMFLAYYVPYKRKREGERLRKIFGEAWDVYDRNVGDYLPRLTSFRHPQAGPRNWSLAVVMENSELWTAMAVFGLALAIAFNRPIIEFFGATF